MEFKSFGSGSSGNMYTLWDGHTKIMIEAGIPIKKIKEALNFKMSELSCVLLSHSHSDHAKSIKDVVKLGIDCYMPHGTADALRIEHNRIKRIEPKKTFKVGTFTILAFDVQHDVEAYGYLIQNLQNERLLFITDSFYCKYRFENLTHIAIEANYSMEILKENIFNGIVPVAMKKRLMRSHFSLENVKEFLKANDLSKVQEIWLLHLSDTNSNAELFKKEIQELTGKLVIIP
jgi:phosphoribosyl 1,2-cyclic phosphodiesterase